MYKKNIICFEPEHFENYEVEAGKIIRWLQNDEKFCLDFFFGTNPNRCCMARLRSNMLVFFKRNYQIVVSPNDFSTFVYEALWSEGTWATLKTYKNQRTFFGWLSEVARNVVLDRLKKERYLPVSHSRTTGNTRLSLLSKPKEMRQLIIDEQLKGNKYHDFMFSFYVNRHKKAEIMVKYCMTEDEFEKTLKKGESELKDALLRSTCWYEDEVLRDKTSASIAVSSEFTSSLEDWLACNMEESPFADVFGAYFSNAEVEERVLDFLYAFSAKLNWDARDRNLWRQRFIHDASPVKLAQALGKTRAWVDTRYSRLNKQFKSEVKEWWLTHGE